MSELIRCASCGKTTNLSDTADWFLTRSWWHIEFGRIFWSRGDLRNRCDDGVDFCSDNCAFNFFKDRLTFEIISLKQQGEPE